MTFQRSTILPLVLFVLLAGLLVGSWYFIQLRERDVLEARLEVTARQVGARLEVVMDNHLGALRQLGRTLLAHGQVDEATFRAASLAHQQAYQGLQALNWVDGQGVIVWVEPEAQNQGALGHDLTRHPVASGTVIAALSSDEIQVTPPLELLQGGWGFAAYLRLRRDGETLGLLDAVFRLPDLLESCIDEADQTQFAYLLRDGDELLGAFGPRPDASPSLPMAATTVAVAGRQLELDVVAAPQVEVAKGTWVDEALLVFGLILAATLAFLIRVAADRGDRAELSARRLRILVENAPDAIVSLDPATGCFIDGNQRFLRMFGLSAERLPATRPIDLSPELQPGGETSAAAFAKQVEKARAGEGSAFEWTFIGPDGEHILGEVHLIDVPNRRREIVRASITDITRRHELEVQLRRTQANEAMGRLAGCVAHDFNNLLTAILGSAEMIGDGPTADGETRELSTTIIEICGRAGNLTRQLLAFSRHTALKPRPLDLADVVRGLQPMLDRLLRGGIEIVTRLDSTRRIVADPGQIEILLLNLVVNARDAMPRGGRITLVVADEGEDRVMLAVEDDGEGIAAEIRERIFEPYFTTKHPDVGTGIGLATVKQIVKEAGGRISVTSSPGQGARFSAVFPACEQKVVAVGIPAVENRRSIVSERTVLVVEDDPDVRESLVRALRSCGCKVLAAGSGEDAVRVEQRSARLDLLVTDIVLPGMTGIELLGLLQARRPRLPALLVSGYAVSALDFDQLEGATVDLLTKPFPPSVFLARVEELLASVVDDDRGRGRGPRS